MPSPIVAPTGKPWDIVPTKLDRRRIVVVANSSVTWSLKVSQEYCVARGIPLSNILSFALGNDGADHNAVHYVPTDMPTFYSTVLQPVGALCRSIGAQAVLLGPGTPISVQLVDLGGFTTFGSFPDWLGMSAGLPPAPLYDMHYVQDGTPPSQYKSTIVWDTKSLDVTGIVNEIRTTALFASGNMMNFIFAAATANAQLAMPRSALLPFRLTVVQGGITVYNDIVTGVTADGYEDIGSFWTYFNNQVADNNGNGAGLDVGDFIVGITFQGVTVNPAVVVDSATLTVNAVSLTGPPYQMSVYGERQQTSVSDLWSDTHLPSASDKTASILTAAFQGDPGTTTLTYLGHLAIDASANFDTDGTSYDKYLRRYKIYNDPPPSSWVNLVFHQPTAVATQQLGGSAYYANTFHAYNACPFIPTGRIGMAMFSTYSVGTPPVPETAAIARQIIANATAAMAAHDWDAAIRKPILLMLSSNDGGINSAEVWSRFRVAFASWGIKTAYSYYDPTPAAAAELYSPKSRQSFSRAQFEAGNLNFPYYLYAGAWCNSGDSGSPGDPSTGYYVAPYNTALSPLLGGGGMMGPSMGAQMGQLGLAYGKGICYLSDSNHIQTGSEEGHVGVLWCLLAGLSWAEAAFYGQAGNYQYPCGDPLWAPYAPTPQGGASGHSKSKIKKPLGPRYFAR